MEYRINTESIKQIIRAFKEDKEVLDMIFDEIKTFEEYHASIFTMEMKMQIFDAQSLGMEEYQNMVMSADRNRTGNHNCVIDAISFLNRQAERLGLEPVYAGIVTKERPHRRDVANAVLAFVESMIAERR